MTTDVASLERRRLRRDEIRRLWEIDRRGVIERIYEVRDGRLVAHDEFHDMRGWPPGEPEAAMPWLEASFDRGAAFIGAFDGPAIVGAAVVDTVPLGPGRDLVQLSFLHVGAAHRGHGLGAALFEEAAAIARDLGASGLYVSATPSENTVRFYLGRGCHHRDAGPGAVRPRAGGHPLRMPDRERGKADRIGRGVMLGARSEVTVRGSRRYDVGGEPPLAV